MNRRQFLRAGLPDRPVRIRPPWALAEGDFRACCTRCRDCSDACPERIIIRGRSGLPEIDFNFGACTFCGACLEACAEGALQRRDDESAPWRWRADIGTACFAAQGIPCRVCGDGCEQEVIDFDLAVGGVVRPRVRTDGCSGCGYCRFVCPAGAVTMIRGSAAEEVVA